LNIKDSWNLFEIRDFGTILGANTHPQPIEAAVLIFQPANILN